MVEMRTNIRFADREFVILNILLLLIAALGIAFMITSLQFLGFLYAAFSFAWYALENTLVKENARKIIIFNQYKYLSLAYIHGPVILAFGVLLYMTASFEPAGVKFISAVVLMLIFAAIKYFLDYAYETGSPLNRDSLSESAHILGTPASDEKSGETIEKIRVSENKSEQNHETDNDQKVYDAYGYPDEKYIYRPPTKKENVVEETTEKPGAYDYPGDKEDDVEIEIENYSDFKDSSPPVIDYDSIEDDQVYSEVQNLETAGQSELLSEAETHSEDAAEPDTADDVLEKEDAEYVPFDDVKQEEGIETAYDKADETEDAQGLPEEDTADTPGELTYNQSEAVESEDENLEDPESEPVHPHDSQEPLEHLFKSDDTEEMTDEREDIDLYPKDTADDTEVIDSDVLIERSLDDETSEESEIIAETHQVGTPEVVQEEKQETPRFGAFQGHSMRVRKYQRSTEKLWNAFQTATSLKRQRYDRILWFNDESHHEVVNAFDDAHMNISGYVFYEMTQTPLIEAGGYSIVLNNESVPSAIVQTESINIIPINELREGLPLDTEGNEADWADAYAQLSDDLAREYGEQLPQDLMIICEKFKKVFPE